MASTTALTSNLSAAKTEQKSQQTPTKVAAVSSAGATGLTQQQSPRNTSTGGAASGTCVQWGPVEVSKPLQDGEKFVKWDDVSQTIYIQFISVRLYNFHYA